MVLRRRFILQRASVGLDTLGLPYNLHRRLWFDAIQPIKEIHQHFQSVLFSGLHCIPQISLSFLRIWVVPELKVLLLERDGVIEEEMRRPSETVWEGISGEVPVKGAQNICEYEGNVMGQGLGKDGG